MIGLPLRPAISLTLLLLASAAFADDSLPFVPDVISKPMAIVPIAKCDLPPPGDFDPANCACEDGMWKCCAFFPGTKATKKCQDPKPMCPAGKPSCSDGKWRCPGKENACTGKKPACGDGPGAVPHVCVEGQWHCGKPKLRECVACKVPPKGCSYKGGDCSTCGTLDCPPKEVTCVQCAAPPMGCRYKGGDCSSCGTVVCPSSKPCVSCMPPVGCTYKGGDGCSSCGTLDCPKGEPKRPPVMKTM